MSKDIEKMLESLSKSKFRGAFHLNNKMKEYIREKGLDKVKKDAKDLIIKRIAPKNPLNDGKQTPTKQVHPVFVAQHATGCCCRGCLERIHHIPRGTTLNDNEINYIINVVTLWIKKEML